MVKDSKLQDVQRAFARHIRDPDSHPAPNGMEDRRMGIYRDLFFNNIKGLLGSNFPVLRRLYGEKGWQALIRDFFVHHRAHTPLFPEVPREFLQFVEEHRGVEKGDPPYLLELAHYEWAELALSLDQAELDDVQADPDGDLVTGVPVLSPLAWLLSYRFPVHHIRLDYRPTEAPEQPTHLVMYRDRADKVHFMEVNAVTARLVERLRDEPESTGQAHLEAIAGELSADPATIVTHGSDLLKQLRERGIVRGTRI
jgi:hypothetical protein